MKTRRAAHAWALGLFLSMVTVASGCYIEHDGWDDDWSEGSGEFGPAGVCFDMCDHLAGCGAIDGATLDACIEGCNAKHVSTPYLVETGCLCVIDAGCADLGAYECPGAPLPPQPPAPPEPGGGSGGSGGSSSGAGGSPAGGSCQADCDCSSGASCVGGACKIACAASCECPTGQSCVGGYCEAPPAPQIPCQVDCDCPSGQVCSAGMCAGAE
ncbi:hypothetical protein [Polyangium spumosum]|nr:hypothetical protein [Polyangium spumosum]